MKLLRSTSCLLGAALFLALPLSAQQTGTVTGMVTSDGSGLGSAQVVLVQDQTGAQYGGLTNEGGRFNVVGVPAGSYTISVELIGYSSASQLLTVEGGGTVVADFAMTSSALALGGIEVFAERAEERRTPVAFTDVSKAEIQAQLGSRDLPLVLNVTPSVYSTAQGGGAGDARINVRGFSQRNTAVMINGVPVNDMENGWVYWSNWAGGRRCRHQHPASARPQRGQSRHAVHRRHAERDHRPQSRESGVHPQAGIRHRQLPQDDDDGGDRTGRQLSPCPRRGFVRLAMASSTASGRTRGPSTSRRNTG